MPAEPWKTDPEELRRTFNGVLGRTWETWDGHLSGGTPFRDLDEIVRSDMETDLLLSFYFDVGWAHGVSEATGWPLSRPGAKEWSPREKGPPKHR